MEFSIILSFGQKVFNRAAGRIINLNLVTPDVVLYYFLLLLSSNSNLSNAIILWSNEWNVCCSSSKIITKLQFNYVYVGKMDFPATPSNASDSNEYPGALVSPFESLQDHTKRRRYIFTRYFYIPSTNFKSNQYS